MLDGGKISSDEVCFWPISGVVANGSQVARDGQSLDFEGLFEAAKTGKSPLL